MSDYLSVVLVLPAECADMRCAGGGGSGSEVVPNRCVTMVAGWVVEAQALFPGDHLEDKASCTLRLGYQFVTNLANHVSLSVPRKGKAA